MGMVERVARAMARVEAEKRDRDEGGRGDGIDWFVSQTWQLRIPEARAAIEAMREPTDEMWAAAWLIYHTWGVNAPDPRDRPNAFDAMKEKTSALLAAMIDKAIQESGE